MWIWRRMEKISWKDKVTNGTGIRDSEGKEDANRRNKKQEEEMDRTCVEMKWNFERNHRRKNGRKAPSRKKASNDVR